MGINSTEVSYGFGQFGSVFNNAVGAISPPSGKVFVAITFLTDTTLNTTLGLVADNDIAAGLEYFGTGTLAHDAALAPDRGESGAGGVAVVSTTIFPAGVTIYGRWTKVTTVTSGQYIAYIGA